MKCDLKGQLTISIEKDGESIFYSHCCVLWDELIKVSSIQEFNQETDIKKYLTDIFQTNPQNHNFYPKNNDCNGTEYCDFSKENFTFLTVSHRACNLKCKACPIDKDNSKEAISKSKESYISILNKIKNLHLNHLQLSANGEPFFFKRETIDYIKSLSKEDTNAIGFVTNATLLNKKDIKTICESTQKNGIRVTSIVSCDGITPETYQKARGINAFNRVVENILEFKKYNKLYCVNFVITPDNIHELKDVPEFWLSKGITPRIIYPICHPEWDWMREDSRVKFIQENYNQYYVNN